jgi:hypothetical protein
MVSGASTAAGATMLTDGYTGAAYQQWSIALAN